MEEDVQCSLAPRHIVSEHGICDAAGYFPLWWFLATGGWEISMAKLAEVKEALKLMTIAQAMRTVVLRSANTKRTLKQRERRRNVNKCSVRRNKSTASLAQVQDLNITMKRLEEVIVVKEREIGCDYSHS